MKQSADEIVDGLRAGDRTMLARAITLVESENRDHRARAREVVRRCLQVPRKATLRIGISGSPGVGKSTFIEAFGLGLCEAGHRVAVLTVDPSSTLTGGSILGDKVRMGRLSNEPAAFIRPSPSRGNLGGVTGRCRETVLLCEVAGFDRTLIETVGVGQSEVGVRAVADVFLLLSLAGGGDEIQCIKKGIVEMADAIVVTKADGSNAQAAKLAAEEFRQVSRMLRPYNPDWPPQVRHCSSVTGEGLEGISGMLDDFLEVMASDDRLEALRRRQELDWFGRCVRDELLDRLLCDPDLVAQIGTAEEAIASSSRTALEATEDILERVSIGVSVKGGEEG